VHRGLIRYLVFRLAGSDTATGTFPLADTTSVFKSVARKLWWFPANSRYTRFTEFDFVKWVKEIVCSLQRSRSTNLFICLFVSEWWLRIQSLYRAADKALARPTSRCILFDGENISFDASLVIYTGCFTTLGHNCRR
jgi:hypothetical protein